MVLNFFQPWETSFSGSDYSTTEVGRFYKTTTWHQGAKYTGSAAAFSKGRVGWVPFLLLMGTLYILGKPRANWNGWRWLPLCAAVVTFAIVFDAIRALNRETEAWTASLSSKPMIQNPPAMQWVMLFCFPLAICSVLLSKSPAPKAVVAPVPS
jgi:hypothetical protein